jgi:hypothetical protein
MILNMAHQIDYEQNYKEVFKLYSVRWNSILDDIILTMKKLDFIF